MTRDEPHIDHAMNARRLDLRLKWKDVTARAGISPQTLSKIRTLGTVGVNPLIIAKVEDALRWESGSLQALTDGGTPTPKRPAEQDIYADMTNPKEAAVWAMDLSESDRREIIDDVRARAAQQRSHLRRA